MFGLEKYKKEDFEAIRLAGGKYIPEDMNGYLLGMILAIGIFGGIEYFYMCSYKLQIPIAMKILSLVLFAADILFCIAISVKNNIYARKYEKTTLVILLINWFIFSIIMYFVPLTIGYCENKPAIILSILVLIAFGIIYSLFILFRLVDLIKKHKMGHDSEGVYKEVFGNNFVKLGISIPAIIFVSRAARRITILMSRTGFDIGPVILMVILGFVIQISMCSIIPTMILIIYCRSTFENFNFKNSFNNKGTVITAKKNKRKKRS